VEYWDPKAGWTELQDSGWRSGVTAMTRYGKGVAVGLANGAVQYWDGTVSFQQGWKELQGTGWGQRVSTLVSWAAPGASPSLPNLIVGLGKKGSKDPGAVEMWVPKPASGSDFGKLPDVKNGSWTELQGNGWRSPVTTMSLYKSSGVADGVVVGLDNGAVQLWNGNPAVASKMGFTELHDSSWASGVGSLIRIETTASDAVGNVVPRDEVVVGLDNGSIEQWSGVITGSTGQGDWKEIAGPQNNAAADALTTEVLKKAVTFAKELISAGTDTAFGTKGYIGGEGDPLFKDFDLQKASSASGTYTPIKSYITKSPAALPFTASGTDASVTLALDTNLLAYGYAFVPDGALAKLVPGKYSLAMLVGLEAGPSLTINLGEGGTINVPSTNLFNTQFSVPGPFGFDRFAVDLGANAALTAELKCKEGACPDKLNAHAYLVPGVLLTWNTNGDPKGIQLGYNYYPDVDYSDFTKLTGVSVTPTVTPYVTGTYGIFFPRDYWIIGGWSLFDVSLGYENPVSATFCADTANQCEGGTSTSVKLNSKGFVTTHVGVLESLTSILSWDGKFQVYDVSKVY
jgi:hypothetical protein